MVIYGHYSNLCFISGFLMVTIVIYGYLVFFYGFYGEYFHVGRLQTSATCRWIFPVVYSAEVENIWKHGYQTTYLKGHPT